LVEHIKAAHGVKEFSMDPAGAVRGWNSKTWKNADWGYSIWSFNGLNILNHSYSTSEIFYLTIFDIDVSRHTLRLSVRGKNAEISFVIQTVSARCIEEGVASFAFHLAIKEAERHFLEPAEGLDEGYKRLSITVELLDKHSIS
jgi:hypothetical protein